MTDLALRPRSATEIIDLAVRLLRRHFGTLFAIAIVGLLPNLVVQLLVAATALTDPTANLARIGVLTIVALPVSLLFASFMVAALLTGADEALRTGAMDARVAIGHGVRRWPTVIGVNLLVGIATLVGFILFIVPGIYVAIRLATAVPSAVLEGEGVIGALRRAWARADGLVGHSFKTLLLLVLIYFVFLLAVTVLGGVGAVLVGGVGAGGVNAFGVRAATQIVTTLATAAVYPLITNTLLLLSYDLRVRREGYDVEAMVASLGVAG